MGNTERVAYLGMNVTKPPLDKPEVRQAIAMALDKAGIAEGILATGEKTGIAGRLACPYGLDRGHGRPGFDAAKAKEIISATPAPMRRSSSSRRRSMTSALCRRSSRC